MNAPKFTKKKEKLDIPWCTGCLADIPEDSGERKCKYCGIMFCVKCINGHEEACASFNKSNGRGKE